MLGGGRNLRESRIPAPVPAAGPGARHAGPRWRQPRQPCQAGCDRAPDPSGWHDPHQSMTIGAEANAIYQDLIGQALDVEIDLLSSGVPLENERLARTFGGEDSVLIELQRLRRLNADAKHFDLGAYHNALLHAIMPSFIESLNEGEGPLGFCGGRYVVGSIDLDTFVTRFFDDLDFAWPADLVNNLSRTEKYVVGIDEDVFGSRTSLRRPPRSSGSPRPMLAPPCGRSSR